MSAEQSSLKKPILIAIAALVVLLIASLVFYKERMLFADAPFIAFNIINKQALNIQVGRYGSFITQVVPYWGVKLGLSIKAILVSYSASFNAFYLLIAATLAFGFRQAQLAIIMALYYFLFISASWFWPNNEIHQAVAWMFLFLGTTLYLGNKNVGLVPLIVLSLPLAFIALSTHYVVLIPSVFLWVYLILENKHWPFTPKRSVFLSLLFLATFALKFWLSSGEQYESSHLHNVTHFSLKDIIDSFATPVVQMFLGKCLVNYWLAILMFFAGLYNLAKDKHWKLFTWSLISFVGYIIILGLTYASDSDLPLFHIESEWACMGIITATPFVFSVLPRLKTSYATSLLLAIFLVRIVYIGSTFDAFNWRIRFQDQVLSQMQKKNIYKLALYYNNDIRSNYLQDWAVTYEGILSSAIEAKRPQRTFTFVNQNDSGKLKALSDRKVLYNNGWDAFNAAEINNNYFSLDTVHPYAVMSYEQLFSQ